jgi:hypothetical protein
MDRVSVQVDKAIEQDFEKLPLEDALKLLNTNR